MQGWEGMGIIRVAARMRHLQSVWSGVCSCCLCTALLAGLNYCSRAERGWVGSRTRYSVYNKFVVRVIGGPKFLLLYITVDRLQLWLMCRSGMGWVSDPSGMGWVQTRSGVRSCCLCTEQLVGLNCCSSAEMGWVGSQTRCSV